ncbi:hypothetical protein GWI33_014377 [Rhynchophorus ferrugineus]|uniref:Uncharacterized protein n=1 Tax=Rhynchophorus ferrugineus TaxID=354439 RepID=A0A834I1S0_RHYFE|nr:hypothetical protein GWI33_014377 [Rhynchophorus ferrugineus]
MLRAGLMTMITNKLHHRQTRSELTGERRRPKSEEATNATGGGEDGGRFAPTIIGEFAKLACMAPAPGTR